MHAIYRLDPVILRERAASERVDARGGHWRVFVATVIAVVAAAVATACLHLIGFPPVLQAPFPNALDLAGAASSFAAVVSAIVAAVLFPAHSGDRRRAAAIASVVVAMLACGWTTVLQCGVLMGRLGFDA